MKSFGEFLSCDFLLPKMLIERKLSQKIRSIKSEISIIFLIMLIISLIRLKYVHKEGRETHCTKQAAMNDYTVNTNV